MIAWIEWVEPFGPNAEPCYIRVTRETAITTQKHIAICLDKPYLYESDEAALADFVTVHWADIIEEA